MNPSSREFVVQEFNKLEVSLRYTFLNLIQVLSLATRGVYYWCSNEGLLNLEVLCRRLAIVQDENPLEICKHVYELQGLKLVELFERIYNKNFLGDCWVDQRWVRLPHFEVYKKFGRKVEQESPLEHYSKTITY